MTIEATAARRAVVEIECAICEGSELLGEIANEDELTREELQRAVADAKRRGWFLFREDTGTARHLCPTCTGRVAMPQRDPGSILLSRADVERFDDVIGSCTRGEGVEIRSADGTVHVVREEDRQALRKVRDAFWGVSAGDDAGMTREEMRVLVEMVEPECGPERRAMLDKVRKLAGLKAEAGGAPVPPAPATPAAGRLTPEQWRLFVGVVEAARLYPQGCNLEPEEVEALERAKAILASRPESSAITREEMTRLVGMAMAHAWDAGAGSTPDDVEFVKRIERLVQG